MATNEYIMIGWAPWAKGSKVYNRRPLGKSWWSRKKPITIYSKETVCKKYLEENEITVPVYVKVDIDDYVKVDNDDSEKNTSS